MSAAVLAATDAFMHAFPIVIVCPSILSIWVESGSTVDARSENWSDIDQGVDADDIASSSWAGTPGKDGTIDGILEEAAEDESSGWIRAASA